MINFENHATFKAVLAEKSPAEILLIAVETQIELDRFCAAARLERESFLELKRGVENLLSSIWELSDSDEPIYASYGANFDAVRSALEE